MRTSTQRNMFKLWRRGETIETISKLYGTDVNTVIITVHNEFTKGLKNEIKIRIINTSKQV